MRSLDFATEFHAVLDAIPDNVIVQDRPSSVEPTPEEVVAVLEDAAALVADASAASERLDLPAKGRVPGTDLVQVGCMALQREIAKREKDLFDLEVTIDIHGNYSVGEDTRDLCQYHTKPIIRQPNQSVNGY